MTPSTDKLRVPYPPDCADCPTPAECKAANDCKVLRQIRHGRERTKVEIGQEIADRLNPSTGDMREACIAACRTVPVGHSAVRKTVVEQCIEAIQALPVSPAQSSTARDAPKAWGGDVALRGPDAPKSDGSIKHLIEYLLTVYERFGNTRVTFKGIQWGASALWKSDEQAKRIEELEAAPSATEQMQYRCKECGHIGVTVKSVQPEGGRRKP